MKSFLLSVLMLFSAFAFAAEENSLPALRGYDPVSYHTIGRPVMGNGNHVSLHQGQHYLFIDKKNKALFDKNPSRYAPVYNGWCAFGVSVNKKFHGDPLVWEIVDGKLYVNLDNKIKGMWLKDVSGNIRKANASWPKIRHRPASAL